MATESMKIIIGADISKGVAGLNNFNKALVATGNASTKASAQIAKVQPGAAQAGTALTNLSRVASDAPFGFIAIQNNLDPLIDSFGRLKNETGSIGGAFKSLGASLIGPAGVGLAFAAVSSAITFAIQKYGSVGNALDALFGSTTATAVAQRDLAKAFAEAEGSAAGEIASIKAIVSIAQDETLSKEARTEAVNKLNQEYDKYLPKLSLENINTQAVTDSVDKLTASLLRQAKIRGLEDLISKETAKQAELFTKELEDNANAWDNIVAAVKSLRAGGNFFTEQQLQGASRLGANFSEAQKRIETFTKFLKELTREEAENGTLADNNSDKQKKAVDLLKQRLEALEKIKSVTKDVNALVGLQESIFDLQVKIAIRDQGKNQISNQELNQQISGFKAELQEAFNRQAIELEAIPRVRFRDVARVELPENIESKVAKATGLDKKIPEITLHDVRVKLLDVELTNRIEFQEKLLADLNKAFSDIAQNVKVDVFASLGESIGEALSGGNIKNIFSSLFNVIASGLQQFGKALIAYGVAQKAFQVATKSLNPVLAIAAGTGLIAAGALLRKALPQFKEGGWATGPSSGYLAMLHGNELIIPENKISRANPGSIQGALSDQPIILQPSVAIQGQALRILLDRVDRSNRRMF